MVDILNTQVSKLSVAALLVAISILAIQPSLAQAQTPQSVTITARGSAIATGNTTGTGSSSAYLTLIGTANVNGENIQLTGMTGIFQIGPLFFTVTGGQGQTSSGTAIQLNLQTNGGSLMLQGTVAISGEGYTILLTPQQSNLAGQYSIWMYGNLWIHT
jgi:hypothetical protein